MAQVEVFFAVQQGAELSFHHHRRCPRRHETQYQHHQAAQGQPGQHEQGKQTEQAGEQRAS